MTSPIWDKGTRAADWVTRFTVGDDHEWDTLLLPYDLAASAAHAWGLASIGVLTADELAAIERELDALRRRHAEGELRVRIEDEDCHTVIERELTARLGDAGRRIHTGRSRNDQVLAALRLFLRDGLDAVARRVLEAGELLCALAESHAGMPLPGYTHMQRAMPSSVALWALGYAELVVDDLHGLGEARRAVNVSPLGSAAGYGVPYLALPRDQVAARLGFDRVQTHVTAVQLTRGKSELRVVHALAQVAGSLNRLASDLVLYATSEYGFVTLPAQFCTGSSIMPQKKNPDVLELARATYHRVLAEMHFLAGLPANLPSGYHRDLQPTKASVMRALLTVDDLLAALCALLPGIRFDAARTTAAQSDGLHATAAALRAVRDGVPFREAYRNAASDTTSWSAERERPPSEVYASRGDPGREDPAGVRRLLAAASGWIPAE